MNKNKLQDRFFLEEIIYRLKNNELDYVKTLTNDWMIEMIKNIPLTRVERMDYLTNKIGINEDFNPYFDSEEALENYINL